MKNFPLHNASFTGERVLSNSGEFISQNTDVIISGRNLNFRLVRNYRSSQSGQIGYFGRGWTFNYARKIVKSEKGLIYLDGEGRSFEFINNLNGSYASPLGMYCELTVTATQTIQKFRYGTNQVFELPENGGRLLQIIDHNDNSLNFTYTKTQIIVTDTFNRKIVFSLTKGLISKLVDFTGRAWKFNYDRNQCLIEVKRPATKDFPNGTALKYEYDELFRLTALLNARGKTFLKNYYDKVEGRVTAQDHGNGSYKFKYTETKNTNGNTVLNTQTTLKNGGMLTQVHNENGNEIQRILSVNASSIAPEENAIAQNGFVDIATLSHYNKHGELIKRVFPSGNSTEWVYSENDPSPKNQGNNIQTKSISSKNTDKVLTTSYQYSADFQLLISETSPKGHTDSYHYDTKGNLIKKVFAKVTVQPIGLTSNAKREKPVVKELFESFEYNKFGDLTQKINADGTTILYCYYTEKDPLGKNIKKLSNPTYQGGLLSSIIKDAKGLKQINGFKYDIYGNLSVLVDGKGNEFEQRFNAMGKVETIVGRKPNANVIEYRYDEDYNVITETKKFEHYYIFDPAIGKENYITTENTTSYTYNVLNNLITRKFSADANINEQYVLDANDNIVQFIQPMGNVTRYKYDERNLMVEKILGAGGNQPSSYKFKYAKSGQIRRYTDPLGNNTLYLYDGYQREAGLVHPNGATEQNMLDDNGNIQKREIWGGADDSDTSPFKKRLLLEEKSLYLDEWNRIYKVDEKWMNVKTGKALGKSSWDDRDGIITSVIAYGDNNLPISIWQEGNNTLVIAYDGLHRTTSLKNAIGQKIQFEYDTNDNITKRIESGNEGNSSIEISNQYDELDRLISQKRNDEHPKSWKYNAYNQVVQTIEKSGIEVFYFQDALGRANGKSYKAEADNGETQFIVRTHQYNDNFYLTSFTDANGRKTSYQYDDKGRLVSKKQDDGEIFKYAYDAKSNLTSVTTPEGQKIEHAYDALGRLGKRMFVGRGQKEESFKYDSRNRVIGAHNNNATLSWEYDSLSRVVKQGQNEKEVAFTYNSAGNLTGISYPGGKNLQYDYDVLGRVTSIRGNQLLNIATYQYNALGQFDNIRYYNGIKALFRYDLQHRLESIVFSDTVNDKLLDGVRYGYDAAGRMSYEVHLYKGLNHGNRYFYDNANRLIQVQYGVENVLAPNSPFKETILYSYSPEGLWSNKMTLDAQGNVLKSEAGAINQVNNYKSLGARAYAYNRDGNCILEFICREGTDLSILPEVTETAIRSLVVDFTYWAYEYDEQNRLSKATECDHHGNILQTIEYFYDSTGHLIARTETDRNGVITHYTFVYAGNMLIQEYVNGVLSNQNVFGPSFNTPLQINKFENGVWTDIITAFDGRQNVTALLDGVKKDALQRFGTNALNGRHIFEINGKPISPNDPLASFGNALTTLLGGFGNAVGKGILGSFGKAQSQFTDPRTGMDMFGGKANSPQQGHTKNPFNMMGSMNLDRISAGSGTSGPTNVHGSGKGNADVKVNTGLGKVKVEAGEIESNTTFQIDFLGIKINFGSNTKGKNVKLGYDSDPLVDIKVGGEGKKETKENHNVEKPHGNKAGKKGGSNIGADGGTNTGGAGVKPQNKGCTCDPNINCKPDSGGYTTGEYDSGTISSVNIKKAEAKFSSNITPMNPHFSGHTITPEDVKTPEDELKKIKLTTGEDGSTGSVTTSEPPSPPAVDPIFTNSGNPNRPGWEGPDLNPENLPGGGQTSLGWHR